MRSRNSLLSWHVYQHSTSSHKVQAACVKFCPCQCSQSTIPSALDLLAGRENIAAAQEQLPPAGSRSHIDVLCFSDDVIQSQDRILPLALESNKVEIAKKMMSDVNNAKAVLSAICDSTHTHWMQQLQTLGSLGRSVS